MHRDPVGNQTRDLRLLVGRFGVWFQAVSLWIFLSLQSLHQLVPAYIEPSHQATCAGDAAEVISLPLQPASPFCTVPYSC